jgi:hypothetical protein
MGPDAQCTCAPGAGTELVAGACASPAQAEAYCGKGARPDHGGCAPVTCPTSAPRTTPADLATGACLPVRALRDLASAHDLVVGPDETLGCGEDDALVVEADRFGCVPLAASCGRGAHLRGRACVANGACPPGSLADHGGCSSFVSRAPSGAPIVDLGTWARLELGPDGGEGAPDLCAPLAQRPWGFTADNGVPMPTLRIDVQLVLDDNDVTRVHARVAAVDASSNRALPARAAGMVERTVGPLLDALRAVGGSSSAASVTLSVRCVIPANGEARSLAIDADAGNEPKAAADGGAGGANGVGNPVRDVGLP